MTEQDTQDTKQTISKWRWVGVLIMIVIMLLSYVFVSSTLPKSLIIVFAFVAALYILFGKRLLNAYRLLAVLLFNTVICFLLMESVSIISLYFLEDQPSQSQNQVTPYYSSTEQRATLSYYQATDWGTRHWEEFDEVDTVYFPYAIWRRDTFRGETINVDENYRRVVPNTNCDAEDAYTVYAFGGSTMWGTGAPDWGTIPAYLQNLIETELSQTVCIINYGESAYVSTQELVLLILELQSGNIPDLVIFYDGINDIMFSSQFEQAAIHATVDQIRTQLGDPLPPLNFSTLNLIDYFVDFPESEIRFTDYNIGYEGETLSEEVAFTYLNNYQIVEQLAALYAFNFAFFVQPLSYIADKPLTEEEQFLAEEINRFSQARQITIDFYDYAQEFAAEYDNLFYLGNIFNAETQMLYTDFMHLVPEGNEIVARVIVENLNLNPNNNE